MINLVAFMATAIFQGPPPGFPTGPVGPTTPSLPGPSASPSDRSPVRAVHPQLALPAPPPPSHHLVGRRGSPVNLSGGNNRIHPPEGPFFRGSSPGRRGPLSSPSGINTGNGNGGGPANHGGRSDGGSSHSTPSPTNHAKNLLESFREGNALSLAMTLHQVSLQFILWSSLTQFFRPREPLVWPLQQPEKVSSQMSLVSLHLQSL